MKKIILISFILLVSSIYSNNDKYAIKLGMNYSTAKIHNDDTSGTRTTEYRLGGEFFLSWKKFISSGLYFNVELGLNQKGVTRKIVEDNASLEENIFSMVFYNLELPLMASYTIYNNIRLYLGVYFSTVLYTTSEGEELRKRSGSFDNGALIGFEYMFHNFLIDFRFQQGLWGKLRNTSIEVKSYYDSNRQFMFIIGYEF